MGWSESREYEADVRVADAHLVSRKNREVHVTYTQYVFHDYDDVGGDGDGFNEAYTVNGQTVSYDELKQLLGSRADSFLAKAVELAR